MNDLTRADRLGLKELMALISCNASVYSEKDRGDDEKPYANLAVRKIISNGPATVVFWEDGTKTVVMKMKGDVFSEEDAFTSALAKKVYGSHSRYKKIVSRLTAEFKKERKALKVENYEKKDV